MSAHKNLAKKYQKKDLHQHILDLPDTYIGSVSKSEIELWVVGENNMMEKRKLEIAGGLYKIFDEIIVNACDHYTRMLGQPEKEQVSAIKVNIDVEKNEISVYNNGEGIPVEKHPVHHVYIPELVFGQLLTSENYDKDEKKIVGGKNGMGASLANIYSTRFITETVDRITGKKYIQEFRNNMYDKDEPTITKTNARPYTKITFYPDLKRFGMEKLDADILAMMMKRIYDLTVCTGKSVAIYLNEKKLEIKQFEKYVKMYLPQDGAELVHEIVNERWEIAVGISHDEEFEQVSFVNGICTYKGGKHVDYVASHIANRLQKHLANKQRNKVILKQDVIKKNMFLFLRCSIENPSFDSQTKEFLTTPSKDFGSKCVVSDKFIEKLAKSEIVKRSLALSKHREEIEINKKEGKKTKTIRLAKLEDATLAGTKQSAECTLILTEGDSAKATAMAGLAVVGRDRYGVFPLKGKPLNVREANSQQLIKNEEINNIKKILGLQQWEDGDATKRKIYKDVGELRYGRIMLFTDQDLDGFHIQGLLMNFIHSFWRELMENAGFLVSLATPIVKVWKGKEKIPFYSLTAYKEWKQSQGENGTAGWQIKYYKGLGTSTREEAQEYFREIDKNLQEYYVKDEQCHDAILLGFSKDKNSRDRECADRRKQWLKTYDEKRILEPEKRKISYHEFINDGLIHFSIHDCIRSIPSICDGLKPSQRKVLFSAFKRGLKNEMKVAQFGAYASEKSAYHHGEASMFGTIIGMAQNFVGANNINLLLPKGQLGTRLTGGKDSASPRYIFTCLNPITEAIFNKLDNPILRHLDDDGKQIEPQWYLPALPMILVNGTDGIGTGYSTNVPCFNPLEIIANLRRMIGGEEPIEMIPWYTGFKGTIQKTEAQTYLCRGVYQFISETEVVITELPVGVWTDKYKEELDEMVIDRATADEKKRKRQCLTDYVLDRTRHNDLEVYITLKMAKATLASYKADLKKFEHDLGLVETINTSNMHLFNKDGVITKYDTAEEILKEYYEIRLEYYLKRKLYWLNYLRKVLDMMKAKIRFLEYVRDGKIDIRQAEELVIARLEKDGFPKFGREHEIEEEGEEGEDGKKEYNYNYLLNMQIRNLTQKKLDALKTEFEKKLAECEALEKKTAEDLWLEDLDAIEKIYKLGFNTSSASEDEGEKKVKTPRKKSIRIKKI